MDSAKLCTSCKSVIATTEWNKKPVCQDCWKKKHDWSDKRWFFGKKIRENSVYIMMTLTGLAAVFSILAFFKP